MTAPPIKWTVSARSGAGPAGYFARSGLILVGEVVRLRDGRWSYTVTGVNVRRVSKGSGNVASAAQAKASVLRAWNHWFQLLSCEVD